jgi:SAM-dependent methyltransferase
MQNPKHKESHQGYVKLRLLYSDRGAIDSSISEGKSCFLCKSSEAVVLFQATDQLYGLTRKVFSVIRCVGCGLIRLHPRPSLEESASYYPDAYWFEEDSTAASRFEQAYRRFVLRDHLAFLKGSLGPVLDVGCGGGLLLAMLRERGVKGIGLDYSDKAAHAAVNYGVPVVCGTLLNAPFVNGQFRLVTMYHVVEHVEDPQAYLQAARALLARDGRLVIQVPNAASWQAGLLGRRWTGFDVPRHLYTFHEKDLRRLLDAAGFEIVRKKHFSLRDNPAGLASSIAHRLDPMARRVRGRTNGRLMKDLAYLSLTLASLPFALLEAACRRGSTIMVEAIKRR